MLNNVSLNVSPAIIEYVNNSIAEQCAAVNSSITEALSAFNYSMDINFIYNMIDDMNKLSHQVVLANISVFRSFTKLKFEYTCTTIIVFIISLYLIYLQNQINKNKRRILDVLNETDKFASNDTIYDRVSETITNRCANINTRIRAIKNEIFKEHQLMNANMEDIYMKRRHATLKNRVIEYLELFKPFANKDQELKLFSEAGSTLLMNPAEEGAVIQKYFGKYVQYNKYSECNIMYPLDYGYAKTWYTNSIAQLADENDASEMTNTDICHFREQIVADNDQLFAGNVSRGLNEPVVEYEVRVFEYLLKHLEKCYANYKLLKTLKLL